MNEDQEEIRDLRVDAFMGEAGMRYRVTHIPSGVYCESGSVAEAIDAVNAGLEDAG